MNGVEKESPKIGILINLPDNHLQNYINIILGHSIKYPRGNV